MTNDVENIILNNFDYKNITFKEQISYLIYKSIWGFIIEMIKYEPDYIKISFKIKKIGDEYCIMDYNDIKYSLNIEDKTNSYYGYYENCNFYNSNLIIKSMFDLNILYSLLESDNFKYNMSIFNDNLILNVVIDKDIINKIINDILLKNGKVKKLSKEDLYD
jgi:hypothetical protein